MSIYALRQTVLRAFETLILRIRIARLHRRQALVDYGFNSQLVGLPRLQLVSGSQLRIGKACILRSTSNSNPIGIDQPVTFCTLLATAQINIGDHVGISGGAICARQLIEIGEGTLIGANTYIFDNDFHPLNPVARANDDYSLVRSAPVRIGRNVFIGTRSIILKGVTIGDNAIIGAGSVVAESIPSNTIASGNPCKIHRQRQEL